MPIVDETTGRMSADVIFIRRENRFWAVPPSHTARPHVEESVSFRNQTGSSVWAWFPGNFLGGTPLEIPNGQAATFPISETAPGGAYFYAAYVVDANQFVEGNSPPEIIIDR